MAMWHLIDGLLTALHLAVILVNLTFWLIPRLRPVHFIVVNLTAFSWIVLGYFYGWGYCFLTDWHWKVKAYLGERPHQTSFIHYFLDQIGFRYNPGLVDQATAVIFIVVWIIAWIQWFLRRRRRRHH